MNSEIGTYMNLPEIISDRIWIHETKLAINRYFKILVNSGMIGAL